MKKYLMFGIIAVIATSTNAHAANMAMIVSPPTLFSFAVMIIAGFCLFGSFQVWNQVKGGLLSRSWQMFLIGFVLLAFSQFLNILSSVEIVALPGFVVPLLLAMMAGVFMYGVHNARKTLG